MADLSDLNPDELPLYELLGLLQSEASRDPAAVLAVADAALERRGPSPWLYAVVGVCELAMGDAEAARDAAREAINLLPGDAALVLYAVPVLLKTDAAREAIVALCQVVRQEPDSADIQALLVEAWLAVDEKQKAEAACATLQALDGGDPRLPQLQARLRGAKERVEPASNRQDPITTVVLTGILESTIGTLMDLVICDAGCGDGIMAQILRGYARKLVGVDPSSDALDRAMATGLYDALIAGDPADYLARNEAVHDLIVVAHPIVDGGDLQRFIAAAAHSLKPGGWLAMTAKREDHDTHNLKAFCTARGLALEQMVEFQLQRDGDSFIDGLAILARRG